MARRTLSANELRRLAEAVDGVRDRSAYIVWGADGPEVKTSIGKHDEVMAECRTTNVVAGRPRFGAITTDPPIVDASGAPVTDVASRYDAMFWSESAVEKFVLPYYIRYHTPREVDEIRTLFDHPSVYAMIHPPLSGALYVASASSGQGLEVLTGDQLRSRH